MKLDKGEGSLKILTDSTLEGFVKENPAAVVDCWAAWCPPCRALSPIIEELACEHRDIAFGKLNVDENPLTPRRYGIMAIPTLLYFKEGRLIDRTTGALPREVLEERLKRLFH
ncbi:MAG: thioredoxin family protein [Candidatus Bathyarchaeia archaeon]|nr:thioredoxin family protein [Candidatus Bathyarchaeota archaeon]